MLLLGWLDVKLFPFHFVSDPWQRHTYSEHSDTYHLERLTLTVLFRTHLPYIVQLQNTHSVEFNLPIWQHLLQTTSTTAVKDTATPVTKFTNKTNYYHLILPDRLNSHEKST